MKKTQLFALIFSVCFLFSCKTSEVAYSTIPQFTTVEKIGLLRPGQTKTKVQDVLGIPPWDAFSLTPNGCQTFTYKYKKLKHELSSSEKSDAGYWNNQVLSTNMRVYADASDLNLVFRNGLLESIITSEGNGNYKDLVWDMKKANDQCDKPVIRGCMDPNSINYNPDAAFDDGSCEYCPCGYELVRIENNTNPNCNEKPKCVKIEVEKPDTTVKQLKRKPKCTKCDIIDKVLENGSGNLDMRIIMNGSDFKNGEIIINEKGQIVE